MSYSEVVLRHSSGWYPRPTSRLSLYWSRTLPEDATYATFGPVAQMNGVLGWMAPPLVFDPNSLGSRSG